MFWAIEAAVSIIMVTGVTVIMKSVNAEWEIRPKGKHRKG